MEKTSITIESPSPAATPDTTTEPPRSGREDLLRRICQLCEALDDSIPADWMIKRVQFFAYELRSLVDRELGPREKLTELNKFYFFKKGFSAVPESGAAHDPAAPYLLQKVLAARAGSAMALAVVYAVLAEQIDLQVEFVDLHPTCFLKFIENGASRFIDLTKRGDVLGSAELIETIRRRFETRQTNFADACETVPADRFLISYLLELKLALRLQDDVLGVLKVQDALLECQPANMPWLGERALLHHRVGQMKNALSDLKRYFAFTPRDKAPADLVKIHDELTALMQKQALTERKDQ